MSVNTPTLITFVIHIVAMVLIGLAAYRSISNFSDYILGGRDLGSFVTALSADASGTSDWLLMGLPDAVYLSGLSESWIAIGLIVSAYSNWLSVVGRLWVQTEYNGNALTLPGYFTNRFEDNSCLLWIFSTLVILAFLTIYCTSDIVAGMRPFKSIFGLSYETTLQAGAATTIAYIFIGGFLAVSWTDTMQASLMISVPILTPMIVMLATDDVEPTFAVIELKDATSLDMLKGAPFIGVISLMAWGLGYFSQSHILARFIAADSMKLIPAVRRISMTQTILCLGGAVAVSLFGIAYFQAYPEQAGAVNDNPERVFIELAKILFNPWTAGVLLSVILAAVMNTLSCQLLVCSSALTEDSYKAFLHKDTSQPELVWVGRATVLLVVVIAIWLAVNPENRALGLMSYVWAGFGAAFGPLVLFSLLWKWMTRSGALVGMIAGTATVILQKNLLGWIDLYEITPGFLFASVATVVFSLPGRAPLTSMPKRFDDAEQEHRGVHQGSAAPVTQC